MALIKCSECGKEISSEAKVCPHCGKTLEQSKEVKTQSKFYKQWWFWVLFVIGFVMVGVCVASLFNSIQEANSKKTPYGNSMQMEQRTATETETVQAEPPFFKEEYQIDNNKMMLTAGKSDGKVLVNVDCRIDGSNILQSITVYTYIALKSAEVSQQVDSLIYMVTDTSNDELSYTTYIKGKAMMKETPSFCDKNANKNDVVNTDLEMIDDAFDKLKVAIGRK